MKQKFEEWMLRPLLHVADANVVYQPRPGAYGIIRNDRDEILLVKEEPGFYLPGGGQDPGESLPQALVREIYEELQANVVGWEYLVAADDCRWSPFYQKQYRIQGHYFLAQLDQTQHLQPEPGATLHWVALEEAANKMARVNERWIMEQLSGPLQLQASEQFEQLWPLLNEGLSIESELYGVDPKLAQQLFALGSQERCYRYLDEQGRIIGAIGIQPRHDNLTITRLVVDPKHQRQGLAASMIQQVVNWFPGLAFGVATGALNRPALALYEKLGFHPVREYQGEQSVPCILLHRAGSN